MVGVLLRGVMMKVGWRPECRWLGCRVADGRCVRRNVCIVCGLLSLGMVSGAGENWGVRDVVVPSEGFCVEGIEAFHLSFGKCP